MKPPRADTRGILPFFGGICRSTLLRSSTFADRSWLWPTKVGGSDRRIHPWAYAHGLLRRRIKGRLEPGLSACQELLENRSMQMLLNLRAFKCHPAKNPSCRHPVLIDLLHNDLKKGER